MPDTQMESAFKEAGYVRPNDLLMQVARDALKASPRNWDGAKDALFQRVRDDPVLLWAMFAPYRREAADKLLTQMAAQLRELEPPAVRAVPSAPGHAAVDNLGNHARCANDVQSSEGRGQKMPGNQNRVAPPSRSGMDAVAAVARLSLLDTFKVNGQSIGDLTAEEAVRWAGAQERDARFVRLLTANLPTNAPIRKFRTGDEVQAIYEQASQEVSGAE